MLIMLWEIANIDILGKKESGLSFFPRNEDAD
jgi:hypothetical protein